MSDIVTNEGCVKSVADKYGDGNLTSSDACELFKVTGVPTVVIIHPEGMSVTESRLDLFSHYYIGLIFPEMIKKSNRVTNYLSTLYCHHLYTNFKRKYPFLVCCLIIREYSIVQNIISTYTEDNIHLPTCVH